MALDNLMTHTVNVQAPNPSKGTSGAEKDSWTTTVPNMPCRVIDASGVWRVLYLQRQMIITHQVFTNQGPTILAGYQLIWNGKVLRVMGVIDLKGKGQVTQIDCQEILGQ